MRTSITIGSRGSQLALIQAESVAARLRELNPCLKIDVNEIVTKGDRNRHVRLAHMEGVGLFVKELEEALIDGKIDLAVHSLKDMPAQIPVELCLTAVTERLESRDVLVSRGERLAELPPCSRIGTGSSRRAVQISACRPDLRIDNIRGNVYTRLDKVSSGEFDGVILAAAAMIRLGCEDKISEYLPLEHFLPAVGQGALGVETRLEDKDVAEFVSSVNHLPTWQSVAAERAFLSTLGGGCLAPIAAQGVVVGSVLKLKGMVADMSGKRRLYDSEEGNAACPEDIGIKLAQRILVMGAAEFISEAKIG